ncbi:LptF/LptG family permease [Planctomicrobium sp. SH668]|uniref:LptF/LptG family permease n=1 Tax=Planctomicrobium sp. SH668 TaxID=3448126 RepID=UPI003F5B96AD
MLPKLPILQRYLFGEVFRVFAFVLFCMTALLVFVGVFQQATQSGLDPGQALTIIPYVIPSMLPFTIPAALLLTVSVVYGRITGDQEVVAAKAAGIHPFSLMWPALVLGAVLSVGALFLTDQVIPWSMTKIEQHIVSFMEDIFLEQLRTEHHFSDRKHDGLLVTVDDVEGNVLIRPTFRYTKGQKICTLQAEEAQIDLDAAGQTLSIRAKNAWIDIPGQARGRLSEKTETIRWDSEKGRKSPRDMPITSIQSELSSIKDQRERERQLTAIEACFFLNTADFAGLADSCEKRVIGINKERSRSFKLNTEIHNRYAMACSCFFFVLLGAPFSMRFGKSQYLTSFLLCFIPIVCCYYPLLLGITTQAKKGAIPPELAMWIANALLAVAAWVVMRKVIRY